MDSAGSEQTPLCPICFEGTEDKVNYQSSSSHSWRNHDRCDGHGICRPCLQRYVELKIMDEGKWNVRCPGVGCSYLLIDEDIRFALADASSLEVALAKRSQLRAVCGGDRLRETVAGALSDPAEAWVLQGCQACPQCLVLTSRAEGCLHMGCRCGCQYCYRCGGRLETCICEFDEDQLPRLALWLVHFEPTRLGDAFEGLSHHWEVEMKKIEEKRREARRRRRAADEAYAESRNRLGRSLFGGLLWLAGAPVLAPREVEDPAQRYEHRLEYWYHDSYADSFDDNDDVDEHFSDDDLMDWERAPSSRAQRRDKHGIRKRTRAVKAWAPLPAVVLGANTDQVATGNVASHRHKVLAMTHPRRQLNGDLASALASQRRDVAVARQLRERQRARVRQDAARKRAAGEAAW